MFPALAPFQGVFYVRAQTQSAAAASQAGEVAAAAGIRVQERLSRVQAPHAGADAAQEADSAVWAVMTEETSWAAVRALTEGLVARGLVASASDVAFALSLE